MRGAHVAPRAAAALLPAEDLQVGPPAALGRPGAAFPVMNDPLPTFRALAAQAAALHLAIAPCDGAALMLADAAPALPMVDSEVLSRLQHQQVALLGAIAALGPLMSHPPAMARWEAGQEAHAVAHKAIMAYYGEEA